MAGFDEAGQRLDAALARLEQAAAARAGAAGELERLRAEKAALAETAAETATRLDAAIARLRRLVAAPGA